MSNFVRVCTEMTEGVCLSEAWVDAYLIPAESANATELFLTGGFSQEAAGWGFAGGMTLFVAGLGIGFALKFLRKL